MNDEESGHSYDNSNNSESLKFEVPSDPSASSRLEKMDQLPPPTVLFEHLSRIDSAKRALSRCSSRRRGEESNAGESEGKESD